MQSKTMAHILRYKVVAIMRKVDPARSLNAAKALFDGGIRILEITFDQNNPDCLTITSHMIKQIADHFGDKMCVGAGTVMTAEQARAAVGAGARFVLAPNVNADVIRTACDLGAVAVPGALSPTEIATAYELGAKVVKLFPAGDLGAGYMKALRGPLGHIPLMAVGGVDENNMQRFFDAGACSVGIGSNVVKNSLIDQGEFAQITKLAERYTQQIKL